MVTHADYIARQATRMINLKDGEIDHDYINPNPVY
jgi:ABC-type lipoprotein export system ATPase subunit